MLDINDEKLKRGYIRLYRSLINWEWFTDVNVCHLFIYCLLRANHSDNNWRGLIIQRGSFITSLGNLSKETGLTIQQIRTALNKLKSTHELTSKGTSRNTVITINNYEQYQDINTQSNKQITNEQQANNKQITTNNNVNNDNNVNNNINNNSENFKKITDPYYSPEIVKFLETFRRECKKPTSLSPDERIKLVNIFNDLIINQDFTPDEIIKTVCKNFNNLNFNKEKINVGINWLLKDSNFYGVLNGQNTKTTNNNQSTNYEMDETLKYFMTPTDDFTKKEDK